MRLDREQAKALTELKGIGWEGDLDQMRDLDQTRHGRPPRRP